MLPTLTRLSFAALLLSPTGCAVQRPLPRDARLHDDSAVLVSTHRLATRPFTVLQRIRGKVGNDDVAFDCVVELSPSKLTVIGMTIFSTRAFVTEQAGVDVTTRGIVQRDIPFEPVQVLYDLHRAFFRGLPAPQTDGVHELQGHGEVVREIWQDGHIVQRSFHSIDTSARLRTLKFEGAPAPVIAPRMRFTDLHYGYSLVIENSKQARLDDGFSLDVEKVEVREARPNVSTVSPLAPR